MFKSTKKESIKKLNKINKKIRSVYRSKESINTYKSISQGYIGICISEKEYIKLIKNMHSLGYMKNIPFDSDGFEDSEYQNEYLNNLDNILSEVYMENLYVLNIIQKYLCDLHLKNYLDILTTDNKCIKDIIAHIIIPYICDYNEIFEKLRVKYLDHPCIQKYNLCKYKDEQLYNLKYDSEHYIFIGLDIDGDVFSDTVFKSYCEKLRNIFGSLFNKYYIRFLNK